jgi:hypothetical protein
VVPADPGFQNVPVGAWTLGAGVTLNPTAAGQVDPGEVDISPAVFCTGVGSVRQSISMPTLAESEPFLIKLITNADCVSRLVPSCFPMDPLVAINGAATSGTAPSTTQHASASAPTEKPSIW